MNLHLIPVLACLVVSHIIQSMARRNRNLDRDITQPCSTPVSTLNHSDVWRLSRTAHSLSWYRSWTILMIFTGIPYAIMMSQRLGRCSESKAFSKSIKLRTRGVCHSYDCSIMLRKMNICSVFLAGILLVLLLASYQLLSSNAQ